MIHHFDIEKLYNEAKNENALDIHLFQKATIESFLDAMVYKVLKVKSEEAERQLDNIEFMQRYLKRQENVNVMRILQAKIITSLEHELIKLEAKNKQLLEENIQLKNSIE